MTRHTKNNNEVVTNGASTEKTANEFIKDFKKSFGDDVEFKAVRNSDGLTIASKGWVEPLTPRLEVTGEDFRRLGSMSVTSEKPSFGVMSGLLKIMGGKR